MSSSTLIVGAGPMAIEYSKVLKALNQPFEVVGRGQASADAFHAATGVIASTGGLANWFSGANAVPASAIVTVSEENLGSTTLDLLRAGVKSILIEKPGGFVPSEIRAVGHQSKQSGAKVFVGYNRRFYASTSKAKELIDADGGPTSFSFEFTEWGHVIREKICPPQVKEEWLLHNSTHVIDTAFFLGGQPTQLTAFKSGTLDWHTRGAVYAGAGTSTKGALFSYSANWAAPGRWVLEVSTRKHRYIFKPMEKLQIQKIGSIAVEDFSIDDTLDKQFKPGLYLQTKAFLGGGSAELPTIGDQVDQLHWFELIENGGMK